MRFCTQCGGMNDDQSAVCSQCGTPFAPGNAPAAQLPTPDAQPQQGYAPAPNAQPQPPQYGAPQQQPSPQYNVQQAYAQPGMPSAYGQQPGYAQPAPQGYPQQPWPPQGQAGQPAPKKKGRLWVWLGPVLGVVVIGVVLLVLWLAGVFGGGGTGNPFIDALDRYGSEDAHVGFVGQEPLEDFGEQVNDAFKHARNNNMHMSYTYVPLKNGGLSETLEEYITDGTYEVLLVVNAQGKYPEMEALARQEGIGFHYIEASPPVDEPKDDGDTAAEGGSSRPSGSSPAASSTPSTPPSQSTSASQPASDNPFINALREYAMDGQQNVKFISGHEMKEFGTWADEALSFREGDVTHISYTYTSRSDLGESIATAMSEGHEVIILVNAGKTYPEYAEKCAAEGIGLHYIEVPFEPPAPGGDSAADLAGNPFHKALMEQFEKGSSAAVMVGQVGDPCMQDALRAQEVLESQGYHVVNLLNEEAGVIYDKVLLLLAAGEVDMVLMANTEYQTLIEAIYEYGFEIVYITT